MKKRGASNQWEGHGSTPKGVLLAVSLLSLMYLSLTLLYFWSSPVRGNTMIGWEGRDSLPGECFPPLRSDQPWQTSPLIRYLSVVHNTTVFLNVLFANSSLSIHMIWMLLRMEWCGGWELPTQVSSMLSRRSAMATMTRTWFNHCNFMMKMIRLLLIISYYNTINVPHKDRDNAPKLLLQIRKLHTMRVPVTFWWWHLPAFAIPLLCGNTLRWWFWNK